MTEQEIRTFSFHGEYLPEHMIGAVLRYFNDHINPGNFLSWLLENNLMEACCHADEKNLEALAVWASFLHCKAPLTSHGSPEKVEAWLAQG